MRKLSDKKHNAKVRELVELVREIVLARGGSQHDRHGIPADWCTSFVLATPISELCISLWEFGGLSDRSDASIYARFADPACAARALGHDAVNPYSGKWNHHYFEPWSPTETAAGWARQLDHVLSLTPKETT